MPQMFLYIQSSKFGGWNIYMLPFWNLSFSFITLQRITIAEIHEDEWFKKGYTPARFEVEEDITLDDVDAAFSSSRVRILSQNNGFEPQIDVVKMSSDVLIAGVHNAHCQHVWKHVDALKEISDKNIFRKKQSHLHRNSSWNT